MNIGPITVPIELVRIMVAILAFSLFIGLNGVILVWLERKVAGHVQRRPGPYEVGPHGLLQPVADALKLIGKQLFIPKGADKILFWAAPILSFLPVFLLLIPMPFGPKLFALDVDLGLLLILAFAGVNVLAICLAGWSSRNKWSLLGAARAVSQCVAYEIPMLLSLLSVAFMEGTLNLTQIVNQQEPWLWNIVYQPLAFIIFFVCAVAETNRCPFDLPEAESELTAGFHTEYSGMAFSMFMLAEYSYIIVVCCVATAVFLGGWHGPFYPGSWWFLGKVYALILVFMWLRWTYPRVRFDQLLNINWKWLLPLSLLNLFVTAFLVKVL
ncbi:NADH:ubiquinone oxidoreductase, membrane subunit H [uncultured Desulfobacterium sp.]|uniref:NADH-quinone oxidoreductase subunit H n=1 Tax=uncultured Desulfobacterium sp. TaxID=201089 RepID=A0A445MRZ1_9BACT|nr:NADH:ubiquinone oxidoreductase, membrane subunit H [uncultured Desulfobacterium sp.]